jgi:hypothetical protein
MLSQLTYQSGSGADTLWVRANDGMLWGNWSSGFTVTAPAARRKNVYCERRLSRLIAHGGRCSMSKAPNEAQGPRCQSPAALPRPSGEKTLDAVQHDLVVIGLHEQRPCLTQLSRILDCAPWRSGKQYLQFRSD